MNHAAHRAYPGRRPRREAAMIPAIAKRPAAPTREVR